jgi:predicted permease
MVVALFSGYLATRRGWLKRERSQGISMFMMIYLFPLVIVLSIWKLNISLGLILLPIIGALTSLATIIPSLIISRVFKFVPSQTGSYIGAAMCSNVGLTLGAFVCFVLLGEAGLSYALIYITYFVPFFFTIVFYISSLYGSVDKPGFGESLKRAFLEPFSLVPNLSVIAGFAINVIGIHRPPFLGLVNEIAVYLANFSFLFASGMTFDFSRVKGYAKEAISMFPIKFVFSPFVGVGLVYLLTLGNIKDKLLLKVVLIESSMPVAVFAMLLPQFFPLDQDLANSAWVYTTIGVLFFLPVMVYILGMF